MNFQNTRENGKNKFSYSFSSYGVKIGLAVFSLEKIKDIKNKSVDVFPYNPTEIKFDEADYRFEVERLKGKYIIIKNDELMTELPEWEHTLIFLRSQVRMAISEFAVSKVFIHAGAVSYKDQGIIFPANSYQGKSTLTAELVKAGATYYSDDCAVLDENALLHPFPKQISIRGIEGENIQTDFPVEHFGGRTGINPVEVKLIVLTEYEQDSKWSPEVLSPGNAVLEMLEHTVPIRFNPTFTLGVLHKLVKRAIILKSKRDEAKLLSLPLFDFL